MRSKLSIPFDDLECGEWVVVHSRYQGGDTFREAGTFAGFEFEHCWSMNLVTRTGVRVVVPTARITFVERTQKDMNR